MKSKDAGGKNKISLKDIKWREVKYTQSVIIEKWTTKATTYGYLLNLSDSSHSEGLNPNLLVKEIGPISYSKYLLINT